MDLLYTLGITLLTLGVLVAVHEYGHFWVARRCGVKVLRFSVGFGKPLLRWRDALGTEYVIAAVPLGGYVKMLDGREGPIPEAQRDQAFDRQPVLSRIAIVAAGYRGLLGAVRRRRARLCAGDRRGGARFHCRSGRA